MRPGRDGARAPVLSAGVVVVRGAPGEPRYLLLRAYRNWDFPKGEVAAGETPLTAARREVREETGLEALDFRWGEVWTATPPYARGKVARYYLAACDHGEVVLAASPELGRPEHHEHRWLEAGAAHALLVPRLRAVLAWARALVAGDPPGAE